MTSKQSMTKFTKEIDLKESLSKDHHLEKTPMGKRHVPEKGSKDCLNEKAQALGFSAEEISRLNHLYKLNND